MSQKSKIQWRAGIFSLILLVATVSSLILPIFQTTIIPDDSPNTEESETSGGSDVSSFPVVEDRPTTGFGQGSVNDYLSPGYPSEQPPISVPVTPLPSDPNDSTSSETIKPAPSVSIEPIPSVPVLPTPIEPMPSPTPVLPTDTPEPTPSEPEDKTFYITIYNTRTKKVEEMPFETFVLCALAAEMDSYAPIESLKAQAVAIRSFAAFQMSNDYDQHHGAMICNSSGHCMAIQQPSYFDGLFDYQIEKFTTAVDSTAGQILTYKGDVALTFFHWCSYGNTDSSASIFGKHYPYLVPVSTSVNVDFVEEKRYTAAELFKKLFGAEKAEMLLNQTGIPMIGAVEQTEGGQLASIEICGYKVKASTLRSKLGLKSPDIVVGYSPLTGRYTFTVYGRGHGVGMSQVGAEVMAAEGSSYSEILYHYYKGTLLSLLTEKHFK